MSDQAIETLFDEARRFAPAPAFAAQANAAPDIYDIEFDSFWSTAAGERVSWFSDWTELYRWELPYAQWFVDATLNVTYNCVDRHVEAGRGDRVAFHWEGEPGDTRTLTYADLQRDVVRFANALRRLGVRKGTPVAIYMGMVPELAISMLACARIGAPHTVVFGGFSAEALGDRMVDFGCEVLVTQDEAWRRGGRVPLKVTADEAMGAAPKVRQALVVKRTGGEVPMVEGRDHWYHELEVDADPAGCPCEPMDSEDLLFLMYTSGTTAKPKGIAHTTGGYLVGAATTHHYVFDLKPENDVYWCAADIGWITGHSYIVYGPLANGATSVMYEGAPDYPHRGIWWELCERSGATIFYTAPTAIRACMKWGPSHPAAHDLSRLRLLGTVGEPINPKAWLWYHEVIGGGRCPIVDTWWQTETGHIMITTLPGAQDAKPGIAGTPLPGIDAAVVDEDGNEVPHGTQGLLVLRRPWPGMLRTLYRDDDRYVSTYWSRLGEETYVVGDAAKMDDEGYVSVIGRIDDVLNVSGHRMSTAEIESAIVSHEVVAEAAVIGQADEDTGQAVAAFVILQGDLEGSEELEASIRDHVAQRIGKLARPKRIIWTEDLPKTRSGKIMRRLLRDIAEGRALGDVTTLRDPGVMAELQQQVAAEQRQSP
jgi:acetyl-CoA synthetase